MSVCIVQDVVTRYSIKTNRIIRELITVNYVKNESTKKNEAIIILQPKNKYKID